MKISIISEYNIFTTIGGTEYYVDMLLKGLCSAGHNVILISKGEQKDNILEHVIRVNSYSYKLFLLPVAQFTSEEIRQEIVSHSWVEMKPLLVEFSPDLIHVHTLTSFFNIRHFELCYKLFPRIIFTSHVPGHFCTKGDLIRNNSLPCDGKINLQCDLCLFSTSWKRGLSNLVNRHVANKLKTLQGFENMHVHVVCVSEWQRKQMIANGYSEAQLTVIRQALIIDNYKKSNEKNSDKKQFRIGFLGRLSPEKGSAFLLKIIRSLLYRDDIKFVLGIPANSDQTAMQELRQLLEENRGSIFIDFNVKASNKAHFFSRIDCLLIPSFCIETGPVVLLEAVYFQKQVLAPGVGGPLEFAAEYPQYVACYKWNNPVSAIEHLEHIRLKRPDNLPDLQAYFAEKKITFIKEHLLLYQNYLTKNTS